MDTEELVVISEPLHRDYMPHCISGARKSEPFKKCQYDFKKTVGWPFKCSKKGLKWNPILMVPSASNILEGYNSRATAHVLSLSSELCHLCPHCHIKQSFLLRQPRAHILPPGIQMFN